MSRDDREDIRRRIDDLRDKLGTRLNAFNMLTEDEVYELWWSDAAPRWQIEGTGPPVRLVLQDPDTGIEYQTDVAELWTRKLERQNYEEIMGELAEDAE